MCRLSIVTTLYNSAGYMDKCLDTLLHQDLSLDEYEIILVNDGSPDNSLEVAEQYVARYTNVRIVSYAVNRGLAGARQAGTDVAKGEDLCYVDPDDYIECESLLPLLERMEREHLDMLRFNYQMVNEEYQPIAKPKDAQMIDYSLDVMDGKTYLSEQLGYACFVWAFIYRTALIKESGVRFLQGDYIDDTPWLPQILRKAERVGVSPTVRYYYLQRSNSLVNTVSAESIRRKLDAQLVIVQRMNEQCAQIPISEQVWHRGMKSKTALQLLTTAAVSLPEEYKHYLTELREMNVFPLKGKMFTRKQRVKMALLNCSPWLFKFYLLLTNK